MAQPNIFVSHSHKDDSFAERLVADLRKAGADAWLDKTDLGAGNFQHRISEALGKCEWFVLVLTQSALESSWVRQEVDAANRLKHLGTIHDLIFVKAGPVEHLEVPPLWGVYNIFDATSDYLAAHDRVLKAVGLSRMTHTSASTFRRERIQKDQLAPEEIMAWRIRTVEYLVRHRYGDALRTCERLLRLEPENEHVWDVTAIVLEQLGRTREAMDARSRGRKLVRQGAPKEIEQRP